MRNRIGQLAVSPKFAHRPTSPAGLDPFDCRAVGDLRRAWDLHLRAGRARPSPETLTQVVDGLAGVRFGLGDTENAVLLLGSAASHRPHVDQRLDCEKQPIEAITSRARAALGESAFEECWNDGGTLDLDAALATAEKMPPA